MIVDVDPRRREALATWCAVWSTVRPVGARTPLELAAEVEMDPRTQLWLVIDEAGRPVGALRLTDSRWTGSQDPVEFTLALFPGHTRSLARILDAVADRAGGWGAEALSVACRDSRADLPLRTLLLDGGYSCVERDVECALTVSAARVWEPGVPAEIAVTTLAERPELAASAHRCFELADADEPSVGQGCSRDFDDWRREFDSPWCVPDDCMLAVDGAVVVGWANLERFASQPTVGWNGFTGTHPDHRGRGIASALKIRLLDRARELGLGELRAENAEGNVPMRRINARMDYVPTHVNEWWRAPLVT